MSKVSLVAFSVAADNLLRGHSGHRLKAGCYPITSPLPSPTDGHRPPIPTVVAEVMCGERRREAFLALAFAMLGRNFKSVWPVLLLLCGRLLLLAVSWRLTPICHHLGVDKLGKREAGQGRAGVPGL